jgi:hypothetical protein
MAHPTVYEAREQARRAREAFIAVTGAPPADVDSPVSCDVYYSGATVMYWFAAQASILQLDDGVVSYYAGAGAALETAGAICEEAASG